MSTTLLFTALLILAPPTEYPPLLGEISRLNDLVNEGEDVGDDLQAAIVQLYDHAPELAADPDGQQLRTNALLSLARARLLADQPSEATAAMDEAIRLARGEPLQVADYGPALEALHEQRLAILAELGTASIQVDCTRACTVFIDEQAASPGASKVALGIHRVWIEPVTPDSNAHSETHRVDLDSPGQVVRLTYSPKRPPPDPTEKPPPSEPRKRLMPVWGEATLLAVGTGLAVAGAILLATDTKQGLGPGPGAALLGFGGAFVLTGGTLLGVDQAAGNGNRLASRSGSAARVMVGWTFRF